MSSLVRLPRPVRGEVEGTDPLLFSGEASAGSMDERLVPVGVPDDVLAPGQIFSDCLRQPLQDPAFI